MGKKKDASKSEPSPAAPENPALAEAVSVFKRGDYVRARRLLMGLAADSSLSEAARSQARDLLSATRSDRAILLTGVAAAALLALVAAATAFIQP